jgi:hypothetical protein
VGTQLSIQSQVQWAIQSCIKVLHKTTDSTKKQREKVTGLNREKKNIETILELVKERKRKFYDVAVVAAATAAAVVQNVATAISVQNSEQAAEQSCQQELWELWEKREPGKHTTFLLLFEPASGNLLRQSHSSGPSFSQRSVNK